MDKINFDYRKYLGIAFVYLSRYRIVVTFSLFAILLGFVVLSVSSVIDPEINEERYAEQLTTLRKVQINEETVEKIKSLDETNVDVDPEFNTSRDNPFAE